MENKFNKVSVKDEARVELHDVRYPYKIYRFDGCIVLFLLF